MSNNPLEIIKAMEAALGRGQTDLSEFFHDDFVWSANKGCGTKNGLEAFERNWYGPWRAIFGNQVFKTERYLADGDWAACFGACHATHDGPFMGLAPTGKSVRIPYIDFWRFADGKIIENRVSVDFADVLAQLGTDVFNGHGWEAFDTGARIPPGAS
ncbi:ester cyclase [Roseibium album]|uniref:Putative ester cyclase n=1 Tax=Roseibium album TaxID=311410 RepID=A0A0M6Z6F7_9HYPH|nr:ester cyclase [Roseibium album]MBG6159306.1 putative ester cyclase [Labrenzia sp. EL_162]MBG6165470.1 putative ester cyclase [Labrenzia sp. EL_195]MBG6197606.1 putative ester cyclase [Labrenzia sp. EL_159]CTQ58007.1 putative ester cyclase [Roseibium album]CTQ67561.1 putative ester cyclase [Roseibium album]